MPGSGGPASDRNNPEKTGNPGSIRAYFGESGPVIRRGPGRRSPRDIPVRITIHQHQSGFDMAPDFPLLFTRPSPGGIFRSP